MIQEFKASLNNYQVKGVIESIIYLENDENNQTTNQAITCTDKAGLRPKVIVITLSDFIP